MHSGEMTGCVSEWVGGWVGRRMSFSLIDRKMEEDEAVGMSYCKGGFGWVGGWEEDVPRS